MSVEAPNHSRSTRIRHELKPRRMHVRSVQTLTPRMVRVVFGGDDLRGFVTLDAGDHMKLAFPATPGESLVMPKWGPAGPEWPPDAPRPLLRDFTPRLFDANRSELTVDFVLHGSGPATTWASVAKPGQVLGSVGPRGSHVIDGPFDWYLMIGDETALPSIARRLEEFAPGTRAVAIIEVEDAHEEQTIDTQADVQLTWVHRNGAASGSNNRLEAAVRSAVFPDGEFYVWAGGEATTLRGIRRHLLNERGVNREWSSFSGHWKVGVADHDHHEPIED